MANLTNVACLAYLRVSTEKQAGEKQTSLGHQRAAIEQRAKALGLTVGQWFTDAGASGGTADRPEFQRMLAFCEASPRPESQGTILCLNDSRWGRFPNPEESAEWRVRFARLGWRVRYCENDDSEDLTVRTVLRAIQSAQATAFREAVIKNAKQGMRGSAEQGYWTRREPYGYRRKVVYPVGRERVLEPGQRKSSDEKVVLVPHKREGRIITELFARYASGDYSLSQLGTWLREQAPERRWTKGHLYSTLRCLTYVGDIPGGRRQHNQVSPKQRTDPSQWYGRENAHPALVSREVFAAVQARLEENRKARRGGQGPYAASGLVRCTHCGGFYIGGGVGNRVHPTKDCPEGINWFYKCASVANEGYRKPCPGPTGTISRHLLDNAIVNTLVEELSRPSMLKTIDAEIDRQIQAARSSKPKPTTDTAKAIAKLEAQRQRLVDAVADGVLTREETTAKLMRIRTELTALKGRQGARAADDESAPFTAADRDAARRMVRDFALVVREAEGRELREVLRPWLKDASFDKRSRKLTLKIRYLPSLPSSHRPEPGSPSSGATGA